MADKTLEETIALLKSLTLEANRATQSGRSRQPYYQKKYADWAKDLIDAVITSGKPYIIPLEGLSYITVKLQWSQGVKYLLDYHDKEGKYLDLIKKLNVDHSRHRGTTIAPKKVQGILKAFQTSDWKVAFQDWMENVKPAENAASMPIFERIGIGLTQEDAKWLNDFLTPLEDMFVWDINPVRDTLKVIRVDRSTAEELLNSEQNEC